MRGVKMYNLTMKSKMLDVLSPDSTAPQAHKDLAANVLKFLSEWNDKGLEAMGDYLADAVWKGLSSLREVDGRVEYVPEVNPQAPEYNPNIFPHPVVSTAPAMPTKSQPENFDFIEI
jgi:hypothetical protein